MTTRRYEGRVKPAAMTPRMILQRMPSEGRCTPSGKVRYRSKKIAGQALAVAKKTADWHGWNGHVYYCWSCKDWHLTHLAEVSDRARGAALAL